MKRFLRNAIVILLLGTLSCKRSQLPVIPADVITEQSIHDTDDPAIWVNRADPSKSLVFGTDKETEGAIFAYDLDGKILEDKTIRGIRRPNNVDVEYGLRLADSTLTDILVFTERERQQIRVFSVPDMEPLDEGGFPVFLDEPDLEKRLPMGIAVYKSPKTGEFYVIVGRKYGPRSGYLYQYAIRPQKGSVTLEFARKFGQFSGLKEIEAIAVDDERGYVYYSDEGVCIRKYHAEPGAGDQELACFGGEYFEEDIEGIAIAKHQDRSGYLLVSNQQLGEFNIFDRQTNEFVKAVNLGTVETDGCAATTESLGKAFPNGLFVAMSDDKTFHFYDLGRIIE
jgi:3-phytase